MTDDSVIEEAAKVLDKAAWEPGHDDVHWERRRESVRVEARRVLAVFEKAHTPTERKPLWSTECGWDGEHDKCQRRVCGCSCHAPTDDEREALRIAHLDARQAAYRKEVEDWCVDHDSSPEIAGNAFFRGWDAAVDGGFRRSEAQEPQGEPFSDHSERYVPKRPKEPQGEPTDAETQAAIRAFSATEYRFGTFEAMRAALRAAGEVKP